MKDMSKEDKIAFIEEVLKIKDLDLSKPNALNEHFKELNSLINADSDALNIFINLLFLQTRIIAYFYRKVKTFFKNPLIWKLKNFGRTEKLFSDFFIFLVAI